MFPPSDRCKPIVKALLAYPDAGTEADHLEVFRGVAQIVRSTVGDRQHLGNLLHPVDKRGVSDGFAGLVRRFYGRGFGQFHCRGFGHDFQVLTGQFSGIFAKGSDKNIKLTTKDDLEIFKGYLTAEKDKWLK